MKEGCRESGNGGVREGERQRRQEGGEERRKGRQEKVFKREENMKEGRKEGERWEGNCASMGKEQLGIITVKEQTEMMDKK